MRPHADDLYLGVAIALVVAGAAVAGMLLRRFVSRPRVAGAAVAAMVLLVLALELRNASDVAAPDVVGVSDLHEPRLPSPTAVTPAPPVMRRVAIPTTTAGPLAPPGRGRPRPSSGPPPPAPPPQGSPPTSTPPSSSVAPIVVPPPVPTTVTVTTAPSDDTTTTP